MAARSEIDWSWKLTSRLLHSSRAVGTTSTILEVKRRFVNEIDGGKIHAELSVGEAAKRSGVAGLTPHFFQSKGAVRSSRARGEQKRDSRRGVPGLATHQMAAKAGGSLATNPPGPR